MNIQSHDINHIFITVTIILNDNAQTYLHYPTTTYFSYDISHNSEI